MELRSTSTSRFATDPSGIHSDSERMTDPHIPMDQEELKNAFYLDVINHDELLSLILSNFGHSSHEPLSRIYQYSQQQDSKMELEIHTNDKGRVSRISLGDDFSTKDLQDLSKKIKNSLVDNQTISVAQVVAFATNCEVDGFFKYKDEFQILPVPEGSAKPSQIVADHPFLLEFKFTACPEPMINAMRRRERETRILRLLSFFTQGIIRQASPFGFSAWVVKQLDEQNWTSECLQQGYFYNCRLDQGPHTATANLAAIDVAPASEYFRLFGSFNHKRPYFLQLPDNLSALFDWVAALRAEEHDKFFFACTWFYYSREIWLDSRSASFMALITAIECLTEKPTSCQECGSPLRDKIEKCATCGEPKYRLTKNFKQFLETHVPFIDQFPTEKRLMYKLRSQLTHGAILLNTDIEPGNWIGSKQTEQDQLHRNVNFIAFVAIYNWLVERSGLSSSQGKLTIDRAPRVRHFGISKTL